MRKYISKFEETKVLMNELLEDGDRALNDYFHTSIDDIYKNEWNTMDLKTKCERMKDRLEMEVSEENDVFVIIDRLRSLIKDYDKFENEDHVKSIYFDEEEQELIDYYEAESYEQR